MSALSTPQLKLNPEAPHFWNWGFIHHKSNQKFALPLHNSILICFTIQSLNNHSECFVRHSGLLSYLSEMFKAIIILWKQFLSSLDMNTKILKIKYFQSSSADQKFIFLVETFQFDIHLLENLKILKIFPECVSNDAKCSSDNRYNSH